MPKIEKSWRQERKERYAESEMDCDITYNCFQEALPQLRQPTMLQRFYKRFPWWNEWVDVHNLRDTNKS